MNFLRLSVSQMTIHMCLGAPFAAPLATKPCDLEGERDDA